MLTCYVFVKLHSTLINSISQNIKGDSSCELYKKCIEVKVPPTWLQQIRRRCNLIKVAAQQRHPLPTANRNKKHNQYLTHHYQIIQLIIFVCFTIIFCSISTKLSSKLKIIIFHSVILEKFCLRISISSFFRKNLKKSQTIFLWTAKNLAQF